MNKKQLIVLPLLALLVTGCKDKVKELYPDHAYASTNFVENYYDTWNEALKTNVSKTEVIDVSGYAKNDYKQRRAEGITPSLNYIRYADQMNQETGEFLDWQSDIPEVNYGVGYGPTKCLSKVDKSFAYGYLSKLYDGRIQCDGFYQKSRVQLSNVGYGCLFPKELVSAKYFALALRGGTTCERQFVNGDVNGNFGAKINLNISLYSYDFNTKSYTQYLYKYDNCPVMTNNHGLTQLFSFYFDETPLGKVPENVTGMSITFEIADMPYFDLTADVNEYKNATDKQLFSVMLYEVLIPDSTWR